jgi:hypothetical protein
MKDTLAGLTVKKRSGEQLSDRPRAITALMVNTVFQDNPFVKGQDKSLPEIYAYGFRNPIVLPGVKRVKCMVSNVGGWKY